MAHSFETKFSDTDLRRVRQLFAELMERRLEIAEISRRTLTAAHPELRERFASMPKQGEAPDWVLPGVCVGSGPDMCICEDFNKGVCRLCSSEEK